MIQTPLSTAFILAHSSPSWVEAVWGVDHGWASPTLLVKMAVQRLLDGADSPPEVVGLAGLLEGEDEEMVQLGRNLAGSEDSADASMPSPVSDLWLYLSLRCLYDDRRSYTDPLREVEELYAEFGYPTVVEPFVGYMPASGDYDPRQHSQEENEARLFLLWSRYLHRYEQERDVYTSARRFGPGRTRS